MSENRRVDEVLSRRALNRATLARQHLLRRSDLAVVNAVEHLVGAQAQEPLDPYVALWSRLEGFEPEQLAGLLEGRQLVRTVVMRGTIHLVTADDCLLLRPLTQPIMTAEIRRHPEFSPKLAGVELKPVLAYASSLLAVPHTLPQLRGALAERFPEHDAAALAYACRCFLALVQVPPRGLWGQSAQVTVATAESWLGRPLDSEPSIDDVVLRYLGAFGPASVADVRTWSRLTGLREVVERLGPRLRTFRDERGRELFDLPDAPRPNPDTPGPVRFLPVYDNILLSHDDRSRFVLPEDRAVLARVWNAGYGSVLADGLVRAVWKVGPDGLVVSHVPGLPKKLLASVVAEGRRLLRFLEAESSDVRMIELTR